MLCFQNSDVMQKGQTSRQASKEEAYPDVAVKQIKSERDR